MLKFNGTKVTPEYEARFQMALWAFRHCRVYCPSAKVTLVSFTGNTCHLYSTVGLVLQVCQGITVACIPSLLPLTIGFMLIRCLQALQHLAPLPAGGIGAADVDVPAALKQLEQEQQQQQLDFLGPELPQDIAQGIAEGEHKSNSVPLLAEGAQCSTQQQNCTASSTRCLMSGCSMQRHSGGARSPVQTTQHM